jgi:hypothetical protein
MEESFIINSIIVEKGATPPHEKLCRVLMWFSPFLVFVELIRVGVI